MKSTRFALYGSGLSDNRRVWFPAASRNRVSIVRADLTLLAEMQGRRTREGIGLAFSTQAHLRETESEGH